MTKKIAARVEDLMFRSKIDAAARHLNVPVEFVSKGSDWAAVLAGEPAVLFLELSASVLPEFNAARAKSKSRPLPVVAFVPHQDKALIDAARSAGIERVLARSQFAETLPDLILEFTSPGLARVAEEEPELPEE